MDLLRIDDLTLVARDGNDPAVVILDTVSLRIRENQVTCLVGESGAGKTMLGRTIASLLPEGVTMMAGIVLYKGEIIDQGRLRALRGTSILYLPQDASSSLNPVLKLKRQFTDFGNYPFADIVAALARFGFEDPERVAHSYPYQLSGGEARRCLLAMAELARPGLLILDEPFHSLDEDLQAQVADFIQDLRRESEMTLFVISHNLPMVRRISDYIYVISQGQIVDEGPPERLMTAPAHPYSDELVQLLDVYE